MKVDGTSKELIQGVSQQPARSRLSGQCTEQINMSSNPVEGLTRRPPTQWVGDLFTSNDQVKFHNMVGNDTHTIVAVTPNDVKVFDLTASSKTVTELNDGYDYLGGNYSFVTLENDTYVVNTDKVCSMDPELPSFISRGPILYIRGGNYDTTYTVTVNWKDSGPGGTARTISASYTTDDLDTPTIRTVNIATQLKTALDAVSTNSFNTLFDVFRVEDILYIQWKTSTGRTDYFTASGADTAGNANVVTVNNDIKFISQLPKFAPHGYYIKVTGDGSQQQDDYYLEFSVTPDDQGVTPAVGEGFGKPGIWVETVKSDLPYLIDRTTMPHVLKYIPSTDEYSFSPGEWADKLVGDADSNPLPTFIGRPINDLTYFQGRLVALSGPAVIMSRTNKPLDFWAETAVKVNDSDPIDIKSTANNVTQMIRAIPNNRDLIIFSNAAQFVVLGRNSITPSNSSLVLTTTFEANTDAPPVSAGRNIFFATNYSNYTGIREFFASDTVDTNDSRLITQHVLKYIPGTARYLAATSSLDVLLVQAESTTSLYTYEYTWLDNQKVQSSWSTWIFPSEVVYYFFVESRIYLISKIGNKYILEFIDMNVQDDEGMSYQVKLDRKRYIPDIETTIVAPVPHVSSMDNVVFIQGEGCPNPGLRVTIQSYNAGTNTVTLSRSMGGGTVICGLRYTSSYTPTMPTVKDADGLLVGTGNLIISKFLVNCIKTGSLVAKKLSKYRDTSTVEFSGRRVGDPDTVVGEEAIVSTSYTIPFRDNTKNANLELTTDSHTPWTMSDIEWVGQYTKTGTRIKGN